MRFDDFADPGRVTIAASGSAGMSEAHGEASDESLPPELSDLREPVTTTTERLLRSYYRQR
jgi:hypothetical protein